jgi:hypothetical protein
MAEGRPALRFRPGLEQKQPEDPTTQRTAEMGAVVNVSPRPASDERQQRRDEDPDGAGFEACVLVALLGQTVAEQQEGREKSEDRARCTHRCERVRIDGHRHQWAAERADDEEGGEPEAARQSLEWISDEEQGDAVRENMKDAAMEQRRGEQPVPLAGGDHEMAVEPAKRHQGLDAGVFQSAGRVDGENLLGREHRQEDGEERQGQPGHRKTGDEVPRVELVPAARALGRDIDAGRIGR